MSLFSKSNYSELLSILNFLTIRKKFILLAIVIFILISSFVELLSIGSVIPFISILFDVKIIDIKFFNNFLELLKFDNSNKIFITFIFISLIVLAAFFRICTIFLLTKFSKVVASDFGSRIFKNNLYCNLIDIKRKNTNNIISVISEKLDTFSSLIFDFLNSTSSILLIIFVIFFYF